MTAALVQANTPSGGFTVSFGAATTAGTLLVDVIAYTGTPSFPAGWVRAVAGTFGSSGKIDIWYYPGNPGGITSVASGVSVCLHNQLLEFSGLDTTAPLDKTGTVNTGTTSPINISTSATITADDELAVSVIDFSWASATKVTLTAGSGFTQAGQIGNGVKQTGHSATDYRLDTGASSSGTTITDALASDTTGWSNFGGVIATFKLPTVAAGLLPQQERHRVPITVPPYGRVMRHSPATYGR
jgi:hypothetical protein